MTNTNGNAEAQAPPAAPQTGTEENPVLEALRRERADFINYKRRIAAERIEDRERARQDLVRELLPAIDDLDRALAHMPDDLRGHAWAQGVVLARQRFLDALARIGVERVGARGEAFDPSVHEAVVYQEHPDAREQHVESVLQPGYRFGPHLLRPAQVVVSGPPRNGRHAHDGQSTGH
jgi:molecular chaperone GrpE